jgi:UDP-GlcNAc:undecaprenyl-phosphate GlcNAc-1-phosphate transferase
VRATFLAGVPIFIFGLWDDYKNIPPLVKFLGQIIAAIILIHLGIYIRVFESPGFFIRGIGGIYTYLDWLITIFWVVGITNAFNFVDSMDGLAVGLGGMAAAFFMLVTLAAQQPTLSLHSAFIIGICTGLYFYNSPPARLFLGDSGAQSLGFILAVLGIGYSPMGVYGSTSWFIPIMLLAVPIFDTVLIIISRMRRKLPIFSARLDHTYHRLQHLGLESNRAVLVMQIVAFSLSCLAFMLLDQTPLVANSIFAIVLILGGLILVFLDRPRHWL